MTTPLLLTTAVLLLYRMLHGLIVEARRLGLDGEVTRRFGRGAPSLSDSRLHLLRQAAIKNWFYSYLGGGQACPPLSAFSAPYFSPGKALYIVDLEGVRFRPRAASRRSGEGSCV